MFTDYRAGFFAFKSCYTAKSTFSSLIHYMVPSFKRPSKQESLIFWQLHLLRPNHRAPSPSCWENKDHASFHSPDRLKEEEQGQLQGSTALPNITSSLIWKSMELAGVWRLRKRWRRMTLLSPGWTVFGIFLKKDRSLIFSSTKVTQVTRQWITVSAIVHANKQALFQSSTIPLEKKNEQWEQYNSNYQVGHRDLVRLNDLPRFTKEVLKQILRHFSMSTTRTFHLSWPTMTRHASDLLVQPVWITSKPMHIDVWVQ